MNKDRHINQVGYIKVRQKGIRLGNYAAFIDGRLISDGDNITDVLEGAIMFEMEDRNETGIWIFNTSGGGITRKFKPYSRYF